VTDDRVIDERKRYTTRLQRRAQAHVTAELPSAEGSNEVDRQVAMLIQHAQEATGARRITLFRPVPRSQRWHTVTLLEDGGFYYGLVAPDTLVLPMVAYVQKRPVLLGPDRPHEIPAPHPEELGFRSYLGLPLLAEQTVVAVLEAVDVAQSELLEGYADSLTEAMAPLVDSLRGDAGHLPGLRPAGTPDLGLTDETVLDLVLRPSLDQDDAFEVPGEAWPLLVKLDGRRPLAEAAAAAGIPTPRARATAAALLERGLLRIGPETRRRG
jgi:hypothetical protein